jgi:hypothetical protein
MQFPLLGQARIVIVVIVTLLMIALGRAPG